MLQTMKSRRELAAARTPGPSALSSKGLCYPALVTAAAAHEELGLLFHCVLPASGEQAVTFSFFYTLPFLFCKHYCEKRPCLKYLLCPQDVNMPAAADCAERRPF